MAGFNFDFGEELENIRGSKNKKEKPAPIKDAEKREHKQGGANNAKPPEQNTVPVPPTEEPKQEDVIQPKVPKDTKVEEQSDLVHTHGGEDTSTKEQVDNEYMSIGEVTEINWKQFMTMTGVFEHVGGDRPIQLRKDIKKSQVSGMPEPMLRAVQKHLKEKYTGAIVTFPWGDYKITADNRVFTTKSTLVRYLMFDAFRDAVGSHVQYAYQWLVLQHPVHIDTFDPEVHLGPTNDELDIYALLFVAHTKESYGASNNVSGDASFSEQDYRASEQLDMLGLSIGRVLDRLNDQERLFQEHGERTTMIQTVLLLDRMGLLQGGLPRDIGEFVRVLEVNREVLKDTDLSVSEHIQEEKERERTLRRQKRMREMQAQRALKEDRM